LSIEPPFFSVYRRHHSIRASSLRPTASVAARQMLGAVDLRRLAEDAGAALVHQAVNGVAQGRVRGQPGVGVRTAAVGAQHQPADRQGSAAGAVGVGQHLTEPPDPGFHGLLRAAELLDRAGHDGQSRAQVQVGGERLDLVVLAAQAEDQEPG
jgi:hypothetical protein